MSNSQFLKWQDLDSDGLIDVCDDLIQVEPFPCGGKCTPRPLAIVPKWKKQPSLVPWLNEKTCYYQVTVVTSYLTTVPAEQLVEPVDEAMVKKAESARAMEFFEDVLKAFLETYNKKDSPDNRTILEPEIQYHKFDLGPRYKDRLKLLFQVPFDIIDQLEDADDDAEEPEDEKIGWTSVEFNSTDFSTKLIRVRRGLNMYSKYLKVYRAIEGGNIKFVEDDSLFNLDEYGDDALWAPDSIMSNLANSLETFLNGLGLQIPGIGSGWTALSRDNVLRIKFGIKDYELKQITVWTEGCAEKPIYINKKLKNLKRNAAWQDKTALAYLSNLYKMDAALRARKPEPWDQFIVKYTYPPVYAIISEEEETPWGDTLSCINDALMKEGKELGQDILDEVFNIGDVIAYKFRKGLCRYDMEELRHDDADMGLLDVYDPKNKKKGNIASMAAMNAYKKLLESDQVFTIMCAKAMAAGMGGMFKDVADQIDEVYEHGLERIKVCGLFDLCLDAVKCLMGGLTLEQALSSMLKECLKAMNMENFGDLFIGLPPDKQAEIDALVKKKFENKELFRPDSPMQNYSDAIENSESNAAAGTTGIENTPLFGWYSAQTIERPFENPENIQDSRDREARLNTMTGTGARRSLAQQFDTGSAGKNNLDPNLVMDLYIMSLMEVYSENYLALLDEINKFPGAEIIAGVLAFFDCPMPPLLNPSIADFMKGIGLPFCQDLRELRAPRFWDPAEWYPDFVDIMEHLWEAFKIAVKQAVMNILMAILVKICEVLGDAMCAALEATGKVAAALPSLLTGKQQIRNVIKDSICGPDADDEKVDNTIVDMYSQLGVGAAALSNRDEVLQFTEDLSMSITRQEMGNLFLGKPAPEALEVANNLIEFEYPQFRGGFRDPKALGKFFENVGNLMPAQVKQDLEDFMNQLPEQDFFPANPSLCLTQQQQDDFADLRCELLYGRASEVQCRTMFDDMIGEMQQDLGDLTAMMQDGDGIEKTIEKGMPNFFAQPGCDDGLFPDLPQPTRVAAANAIGGDFDMLQIDYSKDMLGNGGLFATDKGWGFMNLVLSDTKGNPLTSHHRFARNRKRYVNFASNLANGGESSTGFFAFMQGPAKFSNQEGQFPSYVGEWLMRQFLNAGDITGNLSTYNDETGADYNLWPILNISAGGTDLASGDTIKHGTSMKFNSSNLWWDGEQSKVSWGDLDFDKAFLGNNVDLTKVPDFGYNNELSVDYDNKQIIIEEKGRKKDPDIVLDYKDNAIGMRKGCDRGRNDGGESQWSYGFEIRYYGCDLVDDTSFDSSGEESEPLKFAGKGTMHDPSKEMSAEEYSDHRKEVEKSNPTAITNTADGVVRNRADDNVRIKIVEKVNTQADIIAPLSEMVGEEYEKSDGFDFPPWFENIPIVGWVVQSLVNLFIKPFSSLIRTKAGVKEIKDSKVKILSNEKFEFLAVDNGLEGIDLSQYPKLLSCFTGQSEYTPPVVALSEIASMSYSAAKSAHDEWMEQFFKDFAGAIGTNQAGWKYGARFDYLMQSDTDYMAPIGSEFEGELYENITVKDARTGEDRPARNKDMILGISRDQYRNELAGTPENTRVFYLNPAQYGGSYTSPPVHVKPIPFDGWLGLVEVLFPQLSPCKPQRTDLIDFDEIQEKIDMRMTKISEDPRLKHDPDCAIEVPYNRILDRAGKTGLMALIESAIRIYASTHFFKSIATFSLIQPKFPDNFSNIYSQYIVEVMEERFKDSQHAFWEMFSPFSDTEFWYAFLEQCVQFYAWRLDNGEIQDPPMSVLNALRRLNDYQEQYEIPYFDELMDAKATGDANVFQTLKSYRYDKVLEGVRETEEDAKLILAELVSEQMSIMGNRLVDNLRARGYIPTIFDLDYWIFANRCGGSSIKIVGPEFVEEPQGLPTPENPDPSGTGTSWPGPYYTAGGQFRIAMDSDQTKPAADGFEYGDEYVGYYHGIMDEDGDVQYRVGEIPIAEGSDILRPVADLIKVGSIRYTKSVTVESQPETSKQSGEDREIVGMSSEIVYLGDLPEYGEAPSSGQPFALEKFISISTDGSNWTKYAPTAALAVIKANDSQALISDIYPGTMKALRDEDGQTVGITGDLGVKYGLQFYFTGGGSKKPIAEVSVDSLDLAIGQAQPFSGNTKLLLCLLNMLKSNPEYKMMTSYIFPIKKVTATLALYNDMGFLSSIGEVTVGRGDYDRWVPMGSFISGIMDGVPDPDNKNDWIGSGAPPGVQAKPGSIAFLDESISEEEVDDPYWDDETYTMKVKTLNPGKSKVGGNEGWVAYKNRKKGLFGGIGVLEWDNWDRIILRNSTARIKKMFRGYYHSRDWQPGDIDKVKPGKLWIENMKARMMPNAALGLLPWWRRGKVRTNPFNAKGELCNGPD